MLISLDEAKAYLRVDSTFEDGLILSLTAAAETTVMDVARLTPDEWQAFGDPSADTLTVHGAGLDTAGIQMVREQLRTGVLFALGYLFEHREEADHHDLVMTLRNLLFAIREGVI